MWALREGRRAWSRAFRGGGAGVFQLPFGSLNPLIHPHPPDSFGSPLPPAPRPRPAPQVPAPFAPRPGIPQFPPASAPSSSSSSSSCVLQALKLGFPRRPHRAAPGEGLWFSPAFAHPPRPARDQKAGKAADHCPQFSAPSLPPPCRWGGAAAARVSGPQRISAGGGRAGGVGSETSSLAEGPENLPLRQRSEKMSSCCFSLKSSPTCSAY